MTRSVIFPEAVKLGGKMKKQEGGKNGLYNIIIGVYRVIHKSVKHFKNSQQINYSTDHGIFYADRERNSPSF